MRSSKITYSRSHTRSRSHSPHRRHDHVHHSPKRGHKSPPRTCSKSSKHTSHGSRLSPHISRSSKKSSHVRPKHSRSPSKNIHIDRRSSSPLKDLRTTKKYPNSVTPGNSSISKKKKSAKSPMKQLNTKAKLSETSLFAELVKDRQMRELAMKCLTQNTKTDNEIVEIHDDSDNEQNCTVIDDLNTNLQKNDVNDHVDSCVVIDIPENESQICEPEEVPIVKPLTPSVSDHQSPSDYKEEIRENGIVPSLDLNSSLTPSEKNKPEIVESKENIKITLPLPPEYPEHEQLSPDSEFKGSRKSIKDLPLPPGKFF